MSVQPSAFSSHHRPCEDPGSPVRNEQCSSIDAMSTLNKELAVDVTPGQLENNSSTHLAPKSYFDLEKTPSSPDSVDNEYNPSVNAKPCSPFYNHDVPRPSIDRSKNTPSASRVHVIQVNANTGPEDASTETKRPSIDVEKCEGAKGADGGLKVWPGRFGRTFGAKRQSKQNSWLRPRTKGWKCLAGLTKGQRLAVKLLIALVIVGAMIGVGVGISVKVGGGVYKNNNQTSNIGSE